MNPSTTSFSSLLHRNRQGLMEAECKHQHEQRHSSNRQSLWVRSSWQREGREECNDSSLYVENNRCVTYCYIWSVDLTMWFIFRWLQNVTIFCEFDNRSFTCMHPPGIVTNRRWAKMLWSMLRPMKHLCFLSLHDRSKTYTYRKRLSTQRKLPRLLILQRF
jgi:hypothetical protein